MTHAPSWADAGVDWAGFEAFAALPALWLPTIAAIAANHRAGADFEPAGAGTVLVGLSAAHVVKLYPPFLADHAAFERAALASFDGQLAVPTPQLIATGDHQGWPYVIMSRLPGVRLELVWPTLDRTSRLRTLETIGTVMRSAHAIAPAALAIDPTAWPQPWSHLVDGQRAACRARQIRTGLPDTLLAQLDEFLAGPVPRDDNTILTGEYTPMNLLWNGHDVDGMFDFGDGFWGTRAYDWLGPCCFLAAGDEPAQAALARGYGTDLGRETGAETMLRLLLLHRYSNLPAQIFRPGWREAPSLAALAEMIWPGSSTSKS